MEAQRQEIAHLRSEQQQRLYSRNVMLSNVNVALEGFVFENGIRHYLRGEAIRLGLRGYVRRTHHTHVEVRFDGTRAQLLQFQDILKRLSGQHICDEPVTVESVLNNGHVCAEFTILSNTHVRCAINPRSDGAQWEKKSSSVGSDRGYIGGSY